MTAPSPGAVLPHMRLSWGGSLGDGGEIWSNALAFQLSTGEAASEPELLAIATNTAPVLTNLVSFAGVQVSPAVTLDWIKAVWITNTGRQRDVNTAMYEFPANARPRGAGAAVPWTQTYAVTLRTAIQRGRGHSGRVFPPPCGPMPEARTPYAPADFANALAANYAGAINGLRTQIQLVLDPNGAGGASNGRKGTPVVVSRRTQDGRAAIITPIIATVVDRVADVQHRRTNRVERSEGNASNL